MRVKGMFFIGCTPWVKKVVPGAQLQHTDFFNFLQVEIEKIIYRFLIANTDSGKIH
jgi:hypothetical protein